MSCVDSRPRDFTLRKVTGAPSSDAPQAGSLPLGQDALDFGARNHACETCLQCLDRSGFDHGFQLSMAYAKTSRRLSQRQNAEGFGLLWRLDGNRRRMPPCLRLWVGLAVEKPSLFCRPLLCLA